MSPTSSESPYVSMDLLLYLESGQTMPFHIFADVVMPDFLNHLSQFLPASENDSCCRNLFKEIRNDLNFIKKACGRVKQWEDRVNKEIEGLIIQSSDDAFNEEKEAQENPLKTNFLQEKLEKAHSVVSMLKNKIFSPPELSSVNLDSESSKRSSYSIGDQSQLPPVQLPDQNIINRTISERSLKKIQVVYDGLDEKLKKCLLCFSVFPENAVIKKKVLVHWWVGEGFIDSPSSGGKTVEETGNEFFQIFVSGSIIELVSKKLRPSTENYKMQPSIRDAVIMLAKTDKFFCFDETGNLTANLCGSGRACLVKTVKGSSLRQLTYSFDSKPENIETLFNVNEPHLDFRVDFFSEMKKVRVLQLGSWQASDQQLVEVEDGGFLKGLKKMKDLRYFSLRGISGITELPDAICRLRKLRILNLNGCHNLEKLPEGIGSLSMLTYLDMCKCYFISHMPKGLALLSQLQVLKGFVIRKSRPRVEYCKLADLAKLENLRKLIIHVDRKYDKAEEELLSLPQFKSLSSLSVAWSRIYGSSTPTNETTIQRIVSMKPIINKINSFRSTPPRTPVSKSLRPASLKKLSLLYFTGSKMPDWLKHFNLQNLKKLYLREGESLSDLRSEVYHPHTVEALRLKYLPQLQMNWTELQALFPNLSYLENVECPKLSLFKCDENGEWMRSVNASVSEEVGGNEDNDTMATIADNVSDDQKKADESDLSPSLSAHSNSSLTELSREVQVLQNHGN